MIPRRIELKGFLCYRDEQVVELDGYDLWVFAGHNGSGKSAIFDAMTYALFGAHRAGRQNAEGLINKDSDGLRVAFDFDLGGRRYRIRRTLRPGGRPERQVCRFEPREDGGADWPMVPETNSDEGFKAWVRREVGLTFETFTASVMLRQGEADRLLASGPKDRHEILAGVIDLDRYRRLHRAADDRRKRLGLLAEELRAQLQAHGPIDEAEVEAAGRLAAEAEAERAEADRERTRLLGLRLQAESWTEREAKYSEARRRLERAEALLADAVAVERDAARLRELDEILPRLAEAIEARRRLDRSDERRRALRAECEGLARKLGLMGALADDLARHRAEVLERIERDEAREREALRRIGELSGPLERARLAAHRREAIRKLEGELAAPGPDPSGEVGRLEAEHSARSGWARARPLLERIARHRGLLAGARRDRRDAEDALAAAEAEVRRLALDCGARRIEADSARAEEQGARDRSTRAATLAARASERLGRFGQLEGASACDRCGQALDAGHFADERARLAGEAEEAARLAEGAERELHDAEARRAAAERRREEAERSLDAAKASVAEGRRRLDRAEAEERAHTDECGRACESLAEPLRSRLGDGTPADWPASAYPTAADLEEARRQAEGLADVEERLVEARAALARWQAARARLDFARGELSGSADDADDAPAIAAEHAALSAEAEALRRCIESDRVQLGLAEGTGESLSKSLDDLGRRRSDADRELAAERARSEGLRATLGRALASTPETWADAFAAAKDDERAAWDSQRQELRGRGVEEKAGALPGARAEAESARRLLDESRRDMDAIPEEARCHPSRVEAALADAERRFGQADRRWQDRRDDWRRLGDALARRRELEGRARQAERDLAIAITLADLLGRDGLQRHLLREAEREIIACANPILEEISGGELSIRSKVGDASDPDHALELEAVERIEGRTRSIDVGLLSGSQRFRVAVGLALGIGRFARGLHRPIESVIIDEGFGCLDREGRRGMIAQLNDLRGRLARVILVSHQEEFADAFSDGYRFRRVDGSTFAEPFHR